MIYVNTCIFWVCTKEWIGLVSGHMCLQIGETVFQVFTVFTIHRLMWEMSLIPELIHFIYFQCFISFIWWSCSSVCVLNFTFSSHDSNKLDITLYFHGHWLPGFMKHYNNLFYTAFWFCFIFNVWNFMTYFWISWSLLFCGVFHYIVGILFPFICEWDMRVSHLTVSWGSTSVSHSVSYHLFFFKFMKIFLTLCFL